ncbi:MAG TPA: hypothetical protein VF613_10555 [Longimicrobium sp.]
MPSSRFFLLVAALAHLLGSDFGAWVHRYTPAAGVTVYAPGSQGEPAPAPAHALDCAVCQTLADGSLALPGRGVAVRAETAAPLAIQATPRAAPRFLAAPPSLPRGPPTHS